MPKQPDSAPTDTVQSNDTSLPIDLTQAILSIEGVIRLEPSMRDMFRKADPRRGSKHDRRENPDGINATTIGNITDVSVDVAIAGAYQALATGQHIHDTIQAVLHTYPLEPGHTVVNVLAIEYDE